MDHTDIWGKCFRRENNFYDTGLILGGTWEPLWAEGCDEGIAEKKLEDNRKVAEVLIGY